MEQDKPVTVFFGTPRFAVYTLEALEKASLTPDIIVTAPDKPAGRGLELKESAVKQWALTRDIPVLQPHTLKQNGQHLDVDHNKETGGVLDLLKNSEWDLFLVAAYGKILPKEVLALPRKGALNVHPSLLPRFRGASPVESQILADEREVGVTIILMDEEMDHGPILAQASITPEEWPVRASVLEPLLAQTGGELLAEIIPQWMAGSITPEEQDHAKATFTKKIEKADGEISLDDDSYQNYLKFCAYDGWPGVFFMHEKNSGEKIRVKITDAAYRDGIFVPLTVIPEGKREIAYEDFSRN